MGRVPISASTGLEILCVDHRETEVELGLLKRVLERAGYRVLATLNPHEALEIFRANRIDLVLTEHIVPRSGGPTLAERLKRLKPHVPIAIYSADWAPSPDDMRFAEMFITKLVSADELLDTIELLLDKVQTRAAA